jgi:hypothetical protein
MIWIVTNELCADLESFSNYCQKKIPVKNPVLGLQALGVHQNKWGLINFEGYKQKYLLEQKMPKMQEDYILSMTIFELLNRT